MVTSRVQVSVVHCGIFELAVGIPRQSSGSKWMEEAHGLPSKYQTLV